MLKGVGSAALSSEVSAKIMTFFVVSTSLLPNRQIRVMIRNSETIPPKKVLYSGYDLYLRYYVVVKKSN
jgi:hypothetical protein